MIREKLYLDLKSRVSKERFDHVMRVLEVGKKLGEKFNISKEKIEIAILLHDILKEAPLEELKEMCSTYNYKELNVDADINPIIHGFAAAVYAIEKYNVYDINILNAVKYHTIGRENMSLLERIVYISDGIESGRDYPEVEKIRALVWADLNLGILYEVEKKIKYLENKGNSLHPNAYIMREWLKKSTGGGKEC